MSLEVLSGILTIVALIAIVADVVRNLRKTNTPAFSLAVALLMVVLGVVYGWKNASTGSVGLFLCDMFIIVISTLNARSAVGRMGKATTDSDDITPLSITELEPGEEWSPIPDTMLDWDKATVKKVDGRNARVIPAKPNLYGWTGLIEYLDDEPVTTEKELRTRQDVLKDLGLENI